LNDEFKAMDWKSIDCDRHARRLVREQRRGIGANSHHGGEGAGAACNEDVSGLTVPSGFCATIFAGGTGIGLYQVALYAENND